MEDVIMIQDDDIVKEERQSFPSEGLDVDGGLVNHPQKETNVSEENDPISMEGIDLTQCFQTDKEFDSREAIIKWCQEVAGKNNTVLATIKSVKKQGGKGSVVELGCERSGVYSRRKSNISKSGQKRKRESKKCGCPLKLRCTCIGGNKWKLRVSCGKHNHEVQRTQAVDVLSMEDAVIKEDNNAVKENLSTEAGSSNGSCREGSRSLNAIRDPESRPSDDYNVEKGSVSQPEKDTSVTEEEVLVFEEGIDLTHCCQTDKDLDGEKSSDSHLQKDTNVMEEDVSILREGIDLTQCFQTDKEFDTREAVIHWCQEVARNNNTGLMISKTLKKPEGRGSLVELGCVRSGAYRSHRKKGGKVLRKRKVLTKKCRCPLKLRSTCVEGNKWKLRVCCGRHNHEVERIPPGHSYFRRWKEDEDQLLCELTASGLRPRQVLHALKERSKENFLDIKTIYNRRTRLKLHGTGGSSVMQQVMKLSAQYHYMEWHRKDKETCELKDIIWAHPESTLLAQCFPFMLMIDCTYKTNKFKIPFFHVAGVSSVGTSFTVAYAFIEEETEEHFSWALTQLKSLYSPNNLPSVVLVNGELPLINAISIVFPGVDKLICPFHIVKTIEINCKNAFENSEMWNNFCHDWENVWKAETKEDYVDTYTEFVTTWVARNVTCITYIRDTWLVHKESFILAWIQKIKHFGYTVINRVENERDQLKKCMESSGYSFFPCWETLHNMINSQITHVKTSFDRSLTSVNRGHQSPIFSELRNQVSQRALELIQLELDKSSNQSSDMVPCRCLIRATHGLPCPHEVVKYTQEGSPIPLSAVDPQWKQLSIVPRVETNVDFDWLPEVQLLRQRWIESEELERCSLAEKIKELALC
ncbi:hypothetical protein MKX03_001969 [Papaver bracteatum]|nr:hypothetical protein MKX03_001969 [Papaver bracteatum]